MCLGLPGKVVELKEFSAVVDIAGTKREVSTMMLAEDIEVGDYVMVHVGFAIAKMDPKEAEETLKTILEFVDEDDF
ncbi:hydrogenase expression/formation protein HupF/HypC [Deferribacter desulfuricans SSM1]|uniref:Hydrogenase expression/formation protein HupF/HypC n=1 Tax=Deferribacter desulfuricans (strain DSM 14783 / JCM 11476 / NBRC 101012 / SSM1) TaxID=639282 RepID=D3P8Z7_DEFDS|nr:HypC/HybG/HupF family hydrogenase formation chaperone [Deferribacter desulfuricans]BAI81187.1 hydrogenase expression/formation protein HupF/HypC [Deferribacter desulfuricans SSM1]